MGACGVNFVIAICVCTHKLHKLYTMNSTLDWTEFCSDRVILCYRIPLASYVSWYNKEVARLTFLEPCTHDALWWVWRAEVRRRFRGEYAVERMVSSDVNSRDVLRCWWKQDCSLTTCVTFLCFVFQSSLLGAKLGTDITPGQTPQVSVVVCVTGL